MRIPLVAGNWKLNGTLAEAEALARAVRDGLPGGSAPPDREVLLAPVFTAVHAVARAVAGSGIRVAGQDCHWQERGAFTGEVSASLLRDAGADAVILGHSERRQLFGETDASVARKAAAALAANLTPIVCVGETLEEREAGRVEEVVGRQVRAGLAGLDAEGAGRVVMAYEPVWAIGTGRTATPAQAAEVHATLRGLLSGLFGATVSARVRILYGGSVNPGNVDELMREPEIDGALVGGASLKADSFLRLVGFRP